MSNEKALYLQIYNRLSDDIDAGVYNGGKRLPTEKELSMRYFVSRITAQTALKMLADEGKIIRIAGKGSYVKEYFLSSNALQISTPKRIGLVMTNFNDSFGQAVVVGITDAATKSGIDVILKMTHNNQQQETEVLRSLRCGGCDGVIIQPTNGVLYSQEIVQMVYSNFPLIMIDRNMPGIDVPFVGVDNEQMAYDAVSRLLKAGHRNILLLATYNQNSSTIKARIDGYTQAHIDDRQTINPEYILTGLCYDQLPASENYIAMSERLVSFLQEHPEITAIFGTEYLVCQSAIRALKILNKRQQVALVSIDGATSWDDPVQIAHVLQPQYDIGVCALEQMDRLLRNEKLPQRECIFEGVWRDGPTFFPPISALK